MLGSNGSTKVIAAAGVAGALILLRRALSKRALAAGRNKLDLQLPVPGDIEISQAVKLTPVRELFYDAFAHHIAFESVDDVAWQPSQRLLFVRPGGADGERKDAAFRLIHTLSC